MSGSITFTIPNLPPSINALYQINFHRRTVSLKPEVQVWKTDAKQYIPAWSPREGSIVRADVIVRLPWYCLNGKLKRQDVQNFLKPLLDVITERQGWDDSRAKFGSWGSVDCEEKSVEVTLSNVEV